jgi:hypothetical protein
MHEKLNSALVLALVIFVSSVCTLYAQGDGSKEVTCAMQDTRIKSEPINARGILDALYGMDCLGGQKDDWELAQHVKDALEGVPKEADPGVSRGKIVDELLVIRDSLQRDSVKENAKQILTDKLGEAIENFKKNNLSVIGPHKPRLWVYHAADGKVDVGIDVASELTACKEPVNAPECTQGYLQAKQLVRYVTVTKRALDYFATRDVHSIAVQVNMLEKRWEHYFNDARSQFFWELGINGWLYGTANKGKEGLLSPPDYQVLVLHPSVGLEYVDAKAGDRFREAIVLEGIGINKWAWKDDKMKLPLGMSLIGVYGDRSSVPQVGYGALFHYNNNLSLGVTRRGSETGVILSLDLAKLFLKQSADKQYEFKYRIK